MKRILNSEIFSLIRLVLVIGVLSAMVFSNGEGISLLPFFNAGSDDEISFGKSTEKNFNAYVFSVHGSGKLRNSFVSKHRKNLKHFSLNPYFAVFSASSVLQNVNSFQGQNFDRNDSASLSGVLSEPSDRAPPVI